MGNALSDIWEKSPRKPVIRWMDFEAIDKTWHLSPRLIVNATPLGMAPYLDRSPLPEDFKFVSGTVVYDLVYNPAETLLMQRAKEKGAVTLSGIGMLVEQAALSFELWTGISAPREPMVQAVRSVLYSKTPGVG